MHKIEGEKNHSNKTAGHMKVKGWLYIILIIASTYPT